MKKQNFKKNCFFKKKIMFMLIKNIISKVEMKEISYEKKV